MSAESLEKSWPGHNDPKFLFSGCHIYNMDYQQHIVASGGEGYHILNTQTNEDLIDQLRRGRGDRQQIMLQLYKQNHGLIFQVVRPYLGHGKADEDDLMQTAFIGLWEAVQHYDPDSETSFASYMPYWIKAVVNRSYHSMSHAEKIPVHMQQKMVTYNRIVAQYRMQTGAAPADYVLRSKLNMSQDQLERLRQTMMQDAAISLSAPVPGAEDVTVAGMIPDHTDMISDLCDRLDYEADAAALWAAVDTLNERQAGAIRIKFQGNLPVREVAEQMQLTPGQVNDAISRGCSKLRRKASIKRIARDHGYSSSDLYSGGLQRYLHTGMSCVESSVIRRLDTD